MTATHPEPPYDDDRDRDREDAEAGGHQTGRGAPVDPAVAAQARTIATAAAKKAKQLVFSRAVEKATKQLINAGVFDQLEDESRRATFRAFGMDPDAPGSDGDGGDGPELVYGSADEFLREYLIPLYHRKVSGKGETRWAGEWWHSAEAITRVEALWRSWEFLRQDPATGMSVWLKDHADYHMGVLLSQDGAFATSDDTNQIGDPLPYQPAPEGMFPDQREQETA